MISPRQEKPSPIYTAELLGREWLSAKAFELKLTRPASFRFKPGQRLRFIHEGVERDYSLICARDDPVLALCIRKVEEGFFSPLAAGAPTPGRRGP